MKGPFAGRSIASILLLTMASLLALTCVPTTVAVPQHRLPPHHPIYPIRHISPFFPAPAFEEFHVPFFAFGASLEFQASWWPRCGLLPLWGYGCNGLPIYFPVYIYGEANIQRPQLALKDGTIYSVTDYWLVNGQLHFRTLEEGGTKSVEHVVDFNQLDSQKTMDLDTVRGFLFVLRNEPLDEYLRNHMNPGSSRVPQTGPAEPQQPSAPQSQQR